MTKIFLLLFLFPFVAKSQDDIFQKNEAGLYEISEVVNVDSISAADLYSNAKKFVAINFKSGKRVSQLNDDNTKTVIGKGSMEVKLKISIGSPVYTPVDYTFTIESKDNRYKYTITDFRFYNTGSLTTTVGLEDESYWNKKRVTRQWWPDVKAQVKSEMDLLVSRLKKQMAERSSQDW